MTNDEKAKVVLAEILQAIVETVNEAPNGAPCGPLYMALMHVWPSMTSNQFNMLIDALVRAKQVRRVGHCLHAINPADLPATEAMVEAAIIAIIEA